MRRPPDKVDQPILFILDGGVQAGQLAGELLIPFAQFAYAGVVFVGLALQNDGRLLNRGELGVAFFFSSTKLLDSGGDAVAQGGLLFDSTAGSIDAGVVSRDLGPRTHQRSIGLADLDGDRVDLLVQRGRLGFVAVDRGALGRRLVGHRVGIASRLVDGLGQAVELRHREARAEFAQAIVVDLEVASLAGLELDAAEAFLHFLDDVVDAEKVLLRSIELALGFALADLVFADAGRFLEDGPAFDVRRFQQHVDAALLDDRIGVGPDAAVEEQVANVLEPGDFLVDEIFALAGAIELAGYADGVVVERQRPVGVVEDQVDRGQPAAAARAGSVEDHVGHLAAAQQLGRLLPEHPFESVHDVALAAAVGSDDAGHARRKVEVNPIGEALEAFHGNAF